METDQKHGGEFDWSAKSGIFPIIILYSLYGALEGKIDDLTDRSNISGFWGNLSNISG